MTPGGLARPRLGAGIALVGILLLALGLRLPLLVGRSLGYDELQSLTHAARGIPTGLLSALLHDPHPPLYYALLALWLRFGSSDAAVLALSLALSLASLVSIHHVARVRWGPRVAATAALAFALAPLALHWSAQARMYALVMLLAVWCFHFGSLLAAGSRRSSDWIGAVASELALLYSHVAAPLFLACIFASALPDLARRRDARRRWLGAQASVAAGALPCLFFLLKTGQEHARRPGLDDLAQALALFPIGIDPEPAWLVWPAAALFAALALCAALRRGERAFALAFLALPFAAAAALSHALRPVWIAPRLFAFAVPFFAIALARLLVLPQPGRAGSVGRAVAAATLALMVVGAIATSRAPVPSEGFAEVAARVRREGLPADLVVVPSLKEKWALAWYSMGPAWARGAVREGSWATLRSLGRRPERRALLAELARYGRDASGEPFAIVPADALLPVELACARRVWVVARSSGAAEALRLRIGARALRSAREGGQTLLLLETLTAGREENPACERSGDRSWDPAARSARNP